MVPGRPQRPPHECGHRAAVTLAVSCESRSPPADLQSGWWYRLRWFSWSWRGETVREDWLAFGIAVAIAIGIALAVSFSATAITKLLLRRHQWPNALVTRIRRPFRTLLLLVSLWLASNIAFPRGVGWDRLHRRGPGCAVDIGEHVRWHPVGVQPGAASGRRGRCRRRVGTGGR